MTSILLHFDDSLKSRKEKLKSSPTWPEILEKGVEAFEQEAKAKELEPKETLDK